MTPPGPATHELLIDGTLVTTWHSTSNGEVLKWIANSTDVVAGTVTVRTIDNNHTAWVAWEKIKIMGGCAHSRVETIARPRAWTNSGAAAARVAQKSWHNF